MPKYESHDEYMLRIMRKRRTFDNLNNISQFNSYDTIVWEELEKAGQSLLSLMEYVKDHAPHPYDTFMRGTFKELINMQGEGK